MLYFTPFKWRTSSVLSFFTLTLLILNPLKGLAGASDGCSRTLSNTQSCANKTYVLYLIDKYDNAYHLSGNTATYQWLERPDGTVRILGTGFTHSSLSGDVFTVDIVLDDATTTAPAGSPKSNYCGSLGSTANWIYYQSLTGTVTSKLHGVFNVSIRGAAFQQGTNANTNQLGYGASGWFNVSGGDGYFKSGDINAMLSTTCTERIIECERDVKNTIGCANTPYLLWFKDKYNTAYHLAGDTATYRWIKYTNGDVRVMAENLTNSSLTNDVYSIDILYTGATTTPPSGSPKSSTCFTVGSTNGWIYFTGNLGTVTSSLHGTFIVSRQGPAFQQGMDANITQAGYGASGWLYILGGDGYLSNGDINVMLSQSCVEPSPVCEGKVNSFDPCIQTLAKGSAGSSSTTINISTPIAEIQEIIVEGIYKGGQPTSGSFTNGTTTVNWTSSNALAINNVSGLTDKGYYKATLPAASSVTMNVGNNTSKMYGFMAYVRLKDQYCSDNYTSLSNERYYVYQNTKTTTKTLPVTTATKNITAVLPIVEMSNDTRIATFTLTAGSQSTSVTINTYDLGQSATIQTLSLNNVPGNVTSATLTLISPTTNGDSYVSGNAVFNYYLNCIDETVNRISGYTYFDRNRDTIRRAGEESVPGVTIYLFADNNGNGVLESGESTPIDSMVTNSNGYYEFDVDFNCSTKYVKRVEYYSGIGDPNNAVGTPGNTFASYTMNSHNYIVELDGTVPTGQKYTVFLKTIEDGAYAIISESSDGINFYHNTNIAITSSGKNGYTVTASRNTKFIKFDKSSINTISGYNSYGSTTTNAADYGIYGVEFCSGVNSYILQTKTSSLPGGSSLTTNNIETASFNSGGNHDSLNNFGINGPVFIDGYVFRDPNANGLKEGGENGHPGVKVYLYYDLDLNGVLDSGEQAPIDSAVSSANGYYSFTRQFGCMNQYIKRVEYTSGITNPNNTVGVPDNNHAGFTMDTDNYIVELQGTIPVGAAYQIYLSAIEAGAYAIISESTDGINYYHNSNIPITSGSKAAYTITAGRNVRFIKFDKHDIDAISGYNVFGSTTTNVYDYAIYGVGFCNAITNGYVINTKLSNYPNGTALTTDNIEQAQFTSFNQSDLNNNFGFNTEGGVGNFCGSLKITADHNKVVGDHDLYNFPTYFDITNNALKWAENGGKMASEYGYDIQLTNQVGARLNIEIVGYNPTTGRLQFWGNVDVLKTASNTILYLRHGNVDSAATNPSSSKTWNNNFKAVYHFENLNDATSNTNTGTNYGTSFVSGLFNKSADFDGTSDYIRVSNSTSLDIGGQNLTMSAWVNLAPSPATDAPFATKGPAVNQEAYMFGVDGGTNPVKVNSRVTTNTGHYRDDNGALPVSEWALVHFVYDGSLGSNQKKVYINGSLAYTASASGNIVQGNHDLFIGKRLYGDNRYLKGKMDELRISCASVTSGWVGTEYNNQKNTQTFYTVSTSVECLDPVPVTWLTFGALNETETTNRLNWSTASEMNNSHFEIQRRWEGDLEFVTVGKVVGAGNASNVTEYAFQDYFGEAISNVMYYRLKQVDFDGSVDYSVIRLVDLGKGTSGGIIANVYPIPSRTTVTVELKTEERYSHNRTSIRLMDLSGRELTQHLSYQQNGQIITLDVSQLPTGFYLLEVLDGMASETLRILVEQPY